MTPRVLILTLALALAALTPFLATACDAQYSETGSFFSGHQYKSTQSFPKTGTSQAYDALHHYIINDGGWRFTKTDREAGIIQVVEKTANNPEHLIPLNIEITSDGDKGSTVTLLFTTDPLQVTTIDVQQGMCDMLDSINHDIKPKLQSFTH